MIQTIDILDGELLKDGEGNWLVEYFTTSKGSIEYPELNYLPLDPEQVNDTFKIGQEVKFYIVDMPECVLTASGQEPQHFAATNKAVLYLHTTLDSNISEADENLTVTEVDDDNYSPYCPDCEACGESGCCSPLQCNHTKNGHYCSGYLKELQFGYYMQTWFEKHLLDLLPKDKQAEYDAEWDKVYDSFVMTERKTKEDESI